MKACTLALIKVSSRQWSSWALRCSQPASGCSGWGGAEVSSPALTSLGPFLWQTFVTLQRAVCGNRLLTTSAVPSLYTAQILNTATDFTTQKSEVKTQSNSMRSTCNHKWNADTLKWEVNLVILNSLSERFEICTVSTQISFFGLLDTSNEAGEIFKSERQHTDARVSCAWVQLV